MLLQNISHFQQQIFLQICGLPMGSNLSGILAILFMHKLESGEFNTYHLFTPYNKYMDHIYHQAQDEHEADAFHFAMKSIHPKINFETGKPIESNNGLSLALLDFKVTIKINGGTEFDIHVRIFAHDNDTVN